MPSTYTQDGPFRYDYAIAGIPFLSAASERYPYARETAQNRREQINTSRDVGEQSLDGWWYRSQSTFHMGAGLKYFDTINTDSAPMRFWDSAGVDVWTPGEVTHLRSTSRTYTAAAGFAYSFATEGIGSGEDGYVYADRTGDKVWWKNINGATASITYTGEQILDVTDDGTSVYVLTSASIYKITGLGGLTASSTKIYSRSGTTRGRIAFLKDRLMVITNRNVYALGTEVSGTKALIGEGEEADEATEVAAEYQLPVGYRGRDFADAPNAIYLLAGSEEASFIYAFTISPDDNVSLLPPITVAEAPRGEVFHALITYIGTYVVIGSTLGVRVGIIAGDSSVVMGPLSVKSDGAVRALFATGDYVWAGGAKVDGKFGLYRINLATPLDPDALIFPYAKDLATATNATGSREDFIQSITRFGKSDRLVFSLRRASISADGAGVYEEGTSRLTSGWLETGRIRMDTAQPKVFYKMSVVAGGTTGSLQTQWVPDTGSLAALDTHTLTSSAIQSKEFSAAPDATPQLWAQYRFTLNRTGGAAFQFTGYQLRVNPAQVKRRLIQVPLLCMSQETAPNGRTIRRSVAERIEAMEKVQEAGAPVVFQDFIAGEERSVLVEEVSFVAQSIPENYKERSNYGGVLVLTLRATEETDTAFLVPTGTSSSVHTGKTLNVHGIADTSKLITQDEFYLAMGFAPNSAEPFPRWAASGTGAGVSNGQARCTYFSPYKDLTVTKISVSTGSTAQVGATLCRMGIYEIDPVTNVFTLIARTANDTTLFAANNTVYTRNLDPSGGYPSSITLQAGKRYAISFIVVGASQTPTFFGTGAPSVVYAEAPRISAVFSLRSDLEPTFTTGLSASGTLYWGRVS